MPQAISRRMAVGAIWMVLFKFVERGLGLISTMILARLLVPDDFGLIAMAMSMIAMLELLGAFGFDVALIQKQDADRSHYDTAWTFNVLFGVVSALFLWIIAHPASLFFSDERLVPVISALAVGTLINGFENIGVVNFRKDLDFSKEFWFRLTKKMAGFSVTVPLAFYLGNYWALVAGTLVGYTASVIGSYVVHGYRPRFSLAAAKELFHFSKWLLVNNILFFLRVRSPDLVIGRIAGAQVLGLFTIGYEISNMPTTELVAPINRAVMPAYAKVAHDMSALRKHYLDVISMIALFAFPAGLGLAATAPWLVPVFLGDKWDAVIPVIQILGIYGTLTVMQSNIGAAYLALGRPRILTAITAIYLAILYPSLVYGTYIDGVHGAALACLLSNALILPLSYAVMFRTLSLPVFDFVRQVWRPLLAAISMYVLVEELGGRLATIIPLWMPVQLALVVILGGISYIGFTLLLWVISGRPAGAEQVVLERVISRVRARLNSR